MTAINNCLQGIQSGCGCGCNLATDFLIVVANVNAFTDDNQTLVLNSTLATGMNQIVNNFNMITMQPPCAQSSAGAVAGCCPGYFYATDTNITLACVNKIITNNPNPLPGTGLNGYFVNNICTTATLPNNPGGLDSTWLLKGNNTLNLYSVQDNGAGNLGGVWLMWYYVDPKDPDQYYGCWQATSYFGSYSPPPVPLNVYNFTWMPGSAYTGGPNGPFHI